MQNKIFTTLNQPLEVSFYSLEKPDGAPQLYSTLNGVPLGTSDNSSEGELGAKVISIGARNQTIPGFEIGEYDSIELTYYTGTNNVETVTYKLGADTVAVLTITYVNDAAADDDLIETVTKA